MNIVKSTDFTGEYSLPEIDTPSGKIIFESIALETQKDKLFALMGVESYFEFIEALKVEPLESKWAGFVNGSSYIFNEQLCLFDGIKKMLVFFTWFDYTNFIQSRNTATGEKAFEVQNAKPVLPIQKLVRGYNKGVVIFNSANEYISVNELSKKETVTVLRHMNVFGI